MNAMVKPNSELATIEQPSQDSRVLMMIVQKMSEDPDFDIDKVKQMIEIKERLEATAARKAFNLSFAQFKAEAIKVYKGTAIKDGPLKGKHHANLFDVVVASAEPLARYGLSTSWNITKDEPQLMEVTCMLRHSAGHFETVAMQSAPDTGPGRNAIQARASAKSYLERYTLMAILGIAATDKDDDDGRGSDEPEKTAEEIEAERAAAAKQQEWLDAIRNCTDLTELAARKKELVTSCGGSDKIPPTLKAAWVAKKNGLEKAVAK